MLVQQVNEMWFHLLLYANKVKVYHFDHPALLSGVFLFQFDDKGGGRRKPDIIYIHHIFAINGHIMFPRHLLPHIQKNRIIAALGNVNISCECTYLSHFLLISGSRSSIYSYRFPC